MRELAPGSQPDTLVGQVMPGTYFYSLRADGLTHRPAKVEVQGGQSELVPVAFEPAWTGEVRCVLPVGERVPRLFLETRDGSRKRIYGSCPRIRDGQALFTVALPEDTVALEAQGEFSAGRVELTGPGAGAPRRSTLEIRLEPTEPSDD